MTGATTWPPVATALPERHPEAPAPGTKLPAHYAMCFGCGDTQDNGLRLRITVGEGHTVISQFTVSEGHQGAPGLAHGGVLAAAFDETLGANVGFLLRRHAVTGKLETDFRRPVPVGATLHILSRLDGIAGRKIYVSAVGRLDAEDGPVALRARALFVEVDVSHFVNHGREKEIREYAEASGLAPGEEVEINP